jgi:flagellar motor switch/type III secretory pathway protein FliN
MASLSPEIVADVVATCKAAAAEAAAAFTRALDTPIQVTVGPPGKFDRDSQPDGFDGPGLVVVLTVGPTAALVLLPESTGVVPAWCSAPDATGQSKLTTLAQELGMILLPEQYMPDDFKAAWVKNLAAAMVRGGASTGAATVPLELTAASSKSGAATMIWPAAHPSAVFGAGVGKPEAKAEGTPEGKKKSPAKSPPAPQGKPAARSPTAGAANPQQAVSCQNLPVYSRSLLRIKVPVVVTLARKRQRLGMILELGPGSIIHFDKSCEEMLELDAGGHSVALGEAVKVGDKFGLRITSVRLPDERFEPLTTKQ